MWPGSESSGDHPAQDRGARSWRQPPLPGWSPRSTGSYRRGDHAQNGRLAGSGPLLAVVRIGNGRCTYKVKDVERDGGLGEGSVRGEGWTAQGRPRTEQIMGGVCRTLVV